MRIAEPQLSVAVGSGTLTVAPAGLVCSTTIGAGTLLIIGGVVSWTVIVTVADADPPCPSSTVRVMM